MAFTFVTWNVLAPSYVRASYYPRTDARYLDPLWRAPAVVARARSLDCDVMCFQEVEASTFDALRMGLAAHSYAGVHALKENKPDGCAVFFRVDRFQLVESRRIVYRDGSGHVAQLVTFDHEGKRIAVVNTHLKWDPQDTPAALKFGFRQASEIIVMLQSERARHAAQIVCGDLNVTPESDVVAEFRAAEFRAAHERGHSCNSNGAAKLIDYVFYRGALQAEPIAPRAIDDETPLPSDEEPSDHLPLMVRFA
ncbi:MAG TPA: endonuclease/exonuclease/phosphatase family protein [Polyangiaceae bacterium]|jgi:mRNA deadenylase 3'-5' endonuclease subunit Ccr4|nr:endonuclease/exonuclease/phosphatase family protein [Polyangiaceae bacterium]